ncbi:gluconate 2-dehydrogenase subunit 3 family protein [Parachryseolinea silvisoli]|jgi:gluconate 2-dehydrogenase gamma chain|uniref:gluconate 2-dehydrogenase subunit 3 family protein n=1 Tax=Parachryseolinea silvisoli TaxID=2873601 RepID=UPI002265CB49|nr:gluconate 2-dehydrogenase subunit 3 family protein [Parachryseolinea silvisoli]MCD9018108.1 gluconate 2-dehydrogenase subunit 3 family protein [Parachryseolinea silvisoli]
MDRREALRRTAWIMGGVISAPALAGLLKGCAAKPTIDWKPSFFNDQQGILVTQVAEIIIPKTDTPGAKEIGVPGFIDQMLKEVYTKEDQDKYLASLKAFDEEAKKEHGDAFIDLDPEKQTAFVNKIHSAVLNDTTEKAPAYRDFLMKTKELTLLGFFTSKVGASEVLQYVAVPGSYKGCIPVSEAGNGKTWAT